MAHHEVLEAELLVGEKRRKVLKRKDWKKGFFPKKEILEAGWGERGPRCRFWKLEERGVFSKEDYGKQAAKQANTQGCQFS